MANHILAVDDDPAVLRLIEEAFKESEHRITAVNSVEGVLPLLQSGEVDVCLLNIKQPQMDGLDLARQIRGWDARLPVIFITSLDDSETAIEAMKLGAYELCPKPLDLPHVQDLVERALENRRLMRSPVTFETDEGKELDGELLVGKSPQMVEVYKQIGRVAGQDVPVLIRGESGTGKELVARAIYQHSLRKEQSYLAVNCAALSDTLLESELFGHEQGAFTGADRRHIGKFEQCRDGTIFLDEIGDMSPLLQSKVLRLLQEQAFERVGGTETIETNARIISATNRDLEQMIEESEFRLDLHHRINTFEIFLPPLREREEDIDLLISHFIRRYSRDSRKQVEGISVDAMEVLRAYGWPGNVRELQSVIQRAILMATGPVIVPEDLPEELRNGNGYSDVNGTTPGAGASPGMGGFIGRRLVEGTDNLYAETLERMERNLLTQVLQHTEGNQSRAAEILGITRGSLRNKIRSLGIVIERVVSST